MERQSSAETQVPFVPSISEEEVKAVQMAWANAIKTISKTYLSGGADISKKKHGPRSTVLYGLYGDHEGILQSHGGCSQDWG